MGVNQQSHAHNYNLSRDCQQLVSARDSHGDAQTLQWGQWQNSTNSTGTRVNSLLLVKTLF
jgi:hypothetical protein